MSLSASMRSCCVGELKYYILERVLVREHVLKRANKYSRVLPYLIMPIGVFLGYPSKGSSHGSYMSPVDSAIASGATSGVTTKAPSMVAEGDLEKFEDDDQFQQPPSAGGYGYQGYPDPQQQPRGRGKK